MFYYRRSVAIASAMHRGADWEISGSALGGAPEGVLGNRGAPRGAPKVGRREKTPTPKTRFSIWTLLRAPGRFTTRPLPVHFATKKSVVRLFSVLSKDEIGP